MNTHHLLLPIVLSLLVPACAFGPSGGGDGPLRSPSMDYPLPPVQTANGEVLGADQMRPEDKLRTSPRIGTTVVTPADVPATVEERRPAPVRGNGDPICSAPWVDAIFRGARCPLPGTAPNP